MIHHNSGLLPTVRVAFDAHALRAAIDGTPVSDGAMRLHLIAYAHCAIHKTDGIVGRHQVKRLAVEARTDRRSVGPLRETGWWIHRDDGDYELAGWLRLNQSRKAYDGQRRRWREQKRRQAQRAADQVSTPATLEGAPEEIPSMVTPPVDPGSTDRDVFRRRLQQLAHAGADHAPRVSTVR